MTDLESKLQENKSARLRLIATDGVFSMDGTVAPLPKIIELAKKYDAVTFVDDCHATGFFGKTGRYKLKNLAIFFVSNTISINSYPNLILVGVRKSTLVIWETSISLTPR